MEEFIRIASQLGVPVAGMGFMAWAIYKIAMWLGIEIIKPLVDAHIRFLGSVELELRKQTEAYGVQSKILQQMGERFEVDSPTTPSPQRRVQP